MGSILTWGISFWELGISYCATSKTTNKLFDYVTHFFSSNFEDYEHFDSYEWFRQYPSHFDSLFIVTFARFSFVMCMYNQHRLVDATLLRRWNNLRKPNLTLLQFEYVFDLHCHCFWFKVKLNVYVSNHYVYM